GPTAVTARSGEPVSMMLPRSGRVRGRVLDEKGAPVRRFTIDVLSAVPGDVPAPPPVWSRSFESADGSFRADELPSWPFIVRASSPGFAAALSPSLSVRAGEEREEDLTLTEGCSVSGVVTDGTVPLPGVLVNAEAREGSGTALDLTTQLANQTQSDE